MEILFVYGLVLLFFILVPIFSVVVLSNHPYRETTQLTPAVEMSTTSKSASTQKSYSAIDRKLAYAALAVILLGAFLIAVMSERKSAV
jgi:hypothetical protein